MRTVSVSQAREQLSSFVNWSKENKDYVIIEVRGKAEAVVIPYADFDILQEILQQKQRREAIAKLQALSGEISKRTSELNETNVDELADEISKEAVASLARKGKIRFGKENP